MPNRYDGNLLPNRKELGDAWGALKGLVRNSWDKQDFGPDDSMIASSVRDPMEAGKRGIEWLREQLNTAGGIPDPNNQDEASMYMQGPSPEQQAQASLNVAGLAQLGGMPVAPPSAGGTLGTMARPMMGTGARTDVAVGGEIPNGFNLAQGGRDMPGNMPSQNRHMRGNDYRPENIQKWRKRVDAK